MNLQRRLLVRIASAAALCWLCTVSYALYQSHVGIRREIERSAESLAKRLAGELLLIEAGMGRPQRFPDFEWWRQSAVRTDVCIRYAPADGGTPRGLCVGGDPDQEGWPKLFERVYRLAFDPGLSIQRPVVPQGRLYGWLTVTPGATLELAKAWHEVRTLMLLSGLTLLSVCLLVYMAVSKALRPVKAIVSILQTMQAGDLTQRLPGFELEEWQRIGCAINRFAGGQHELLVERRRLLAKMMTLQEDERRYLARELHDEFGQCLAAVNALASSIQLTASEQCPELVGEAGQIGRIADRMLNNLRDLLCRLRPAELDELGLAAGLNRLVADWHFRGGGIRYRLAIDGDCALLAEAQAVALYRIAQECLTNIAKHAKASQVELHLIVSASRVELIIRDDGVAGNLPFPDSGGVGLAGMRERIEALNGRLDLQLANPHGLIVKADLPLAEVSEGNL